MNENRIPITKDELELVAGLLREFKSGLESGEISGSPWTPDEIKNLLQKLK